MAYRVQRPGRRWLRSPPRLLGGPEFPNLSSPVYYDTEESMVACAGRVAENPAEVAARRLLGAAVPEALCGVDN